MTEPTPNVERRQFVRLDYVKPVAYKVCKPETIDKILAGYTSNVSEAGVLCRIRQKVNPDDILWLSFDRGTLIICEELEKRSLIYQSGVVGKVVRVEPHDDGTYSVGIQFITREEKEESHILPKIAFLTEAQIAAGETGDDDDDEDDEPPLSEDDSARDTLRPEDE